jgi:hypothetical protein
MPVGRDKGRAGDRPSSARRRASTGQRTGVGSLLPTIEAMRKEIEKGLKREAR